MRIRRPLAYRAVGWMLAGLLMGGCRIGYELEQIVTTAGAGSSAASTTQGGQIGGHGAGSSSGETSGPGGGSSSNAGNATAGGAPSRAGASMMGDSGAAGASVDGGSLTVTSTPIQSGTDIDLTTLGSSDWAHWGLDGPDQVNRKQGGSLLGPVLAIGNEVFIAYDDSLFGFTWTDGTPTLSATYTTTGIWVPGVGNGFRFSVPADAQRRSLTIYVGVYQGQAELSVSLEDGSAAPFSDASTSARGPAGATVAYAIDYQAASPGQSLAVEWTLIDGRQTGGRVPNVTWQAATIP